METQEEVKAPEPQRGGLAVEKTRMIAHECTVNITNNTSSSEDKE